MVNFHTNDMVMEMVHSSSIACVNTRFPSCSITAISILKSTDGLHNIISKLLQECSSYL